MGRPPRQTRGSPSGNYEYHYDDRDRCTAESGEAGHVALRFSYDETDPGIGFRVTTATDSAGGTTRYLVNNPLQTVAETDALGNTIRTEYDADDQVTSVTDTLGGRTAFDYDEHGHMTALHRPAGSRTTIDHNGLGLPSQLTGPDG